LGAELQELWPTSSTLEERISVHDALLDPENAHVGMLMDHLVHEHTVHPDRLETRRNRVKLVVMHLAHHPAARGDVEAVQRVVDHAEIHGPIPVGGIVVFRGTQFTPKTLDIMKRELIRVAGHDQFVVLLLAVDAPVALAVIDAKMAIDEVRTKLGVE
jgi:hypothetical protein